MKTIGETTMMDVLTDEKIYVSINTHDQFIGITLSAEHGSDVEAFFSIEDAPKIIQWLQVGVQKISVK